MKFATLSQVSSLGPTIIPIFTESYITFVDTDSGSGLTSTATSAGTVFVSDAATSLYTVPSNANSILKYAFEAALKGNSSGTYYAALWDTTSNAIVSASQVSWSSGAVQRTRSAKFQLTPGHSYAITFWGTTGTTLLFSGNIVIFGQ